MLSPCSVFRAMRTPSLCHQRTQVGRLTSPGTPTSHPASLYLGRSYFHISVPDFNVVSKSFLKYFCFLWKVSSKLFPHRNLDFPLCEFLSKAFIYRELLSALFPGCKHQIPPRILPLQEPGAHPLSLALHTFPSCLAAHLPCCLAHPTKCFGLSRSGRKRGKAGSSGSASSRCSLSCALIPLLTFIAFPREVLEPLACFNNTLGL